EYGMLTNEEFCEKALKFALLKSTTSDKYYSLDEYKTLIEAAQKDKDNKLVYLYATDPVAQYSYIEAAKAKGYDVLLLDCELDSHFVNLLETKLKDSSFARVDSDSIENLIKKADEIKPELSDDDKKSLDEMVKASLPSGYEYSVEARNLGENEAPVLLTQTEFMRRYREMSKMGGGMNFYGQIPESYNVIVNMEHPLVKKFWENKDKELLKNMTDLALLGAGLLKGKDLTDFVKRSYEML
ncbi:MAG: molecular chaperone HtpG, partial [Prevotella sp.]|nr:molecular chaperone HtpG [Candidatus Equicola stercoris]